MKLEDSKIGSRISGGATLAGSSSRNEIKDVNRPCSQRLSHTPVVDGIRGESDIACLMSFLAKFLSSEDLFSVSVSSS